MPIVPSRSPLTTRTCAPMTGVGSGFDGCTDCAGLLQEGEGQGARNNENGSWWNNWSGARNLADACGLPHSEHASNLPTSSERTLKQRRASFDHHSTSRSNLDNTTMQPSGEDLRA